MRRTRLLSAGKSVVAILCATCYLAMSLGSVSQAVADDTWASWSRTAAEPAMTLKPAMDANGAASDWEKWSRKPVIDQKRDGDAAGKKIATKRSYGTIGWIALGIVAAIGIGIAVGGGGGGDTATNPGHQ